MVANTVNDFWKRVDKVSNPNGCWIWKGGKAADGYGYFWFNNKMVKAHRFSAELAGMTPGDLFVCHKCDNRECVNPAHFFLGTHTDNMRDMFSKGRRPDVRKLGVDHGMAKLSESDVLLIRKECAHSYIDYKKWAHIYNVHPDTIKCIVKRQTWKHL